MVGSSGHRVIGPYEHGVSMIGHRTIVLVYSLLTDPWLGVAYVLQVLHVLAHGCGIRVVLAPHILVQLWALWRIEPVITPHPRLPWQPHGLAAATTTRCNPSRPLHPPAVVVQPLVPGHFECHQLPLHHGPANAYNVA